MNLFIKITLATLSFFIFNACSSNNIIKNTQTHTYNDDFGLIPNHHADALIQKEYSSMNQPTQIDVPVLTDPELSTELNIEADAFLAEDYVETPEVITYKYQFDPKFYSHAEWRRMDLH